MFPPQEKEVLSANEAVKDPLKVRAKEIAAKLLGKMPIIYATPKMASVAYRRKTQINENAKKLVLTHFYPEADKVDARRQCAKEYQGKIILAKDFMEIKL